ncbi:MAG: BPSS1780 family membrane protein [Burkholderiales bacterium]
MSSNPYAAPKAAVADQAVAVKGNFVHGGRGVAAGRGTSWIGSAWDLFKQAPGVWIGMIIVMFVLFVVANFIPLVGPLAVSIVFGIFMGGLMLGCRALEEGGELEFAHLFAGFRQKLGTLAAVGALYVAGYVVIMLIVVVVTGASFFTMMGMGGDPQAGDPTAMLATMGVAILLMMALTVPLLMTVWLAAPLVMFHEHGAIEAMKASFTGCLKNMLSFLVYGIVMFLLAIAATIPIGLGWLVLGPMMAASVYTAYRDIYFSN